MISFVSAFHPTLSLSSPIQNQPLKVLTRLALSLPPALSFLPSHHPPYPSHHSSYPYLHPLTHPQLSGKVRVPHEAKSLHLALLDAESGRAQTLEGSSLDVAVLIPTVPDDFQLEKGEILHLPPTPTMIEDRERAQGRERSMEMSEEEANELERRLSRVQVEQDGEGERKRAGSGVYTPPSLSPPSGGSPSMGAHRGVGPALPVRRNLPPPLGAREVKSPLASTPDGGGSPAGSSLDLPVATTTIKRAVPPPPPAVAAPSDEKDLVDLDVKEEQEEVTLSVPEKEKGKEVEVVEEEKREEEMGAGVGGEPSLPEYEDVVLDAPPSMDALEEKRKLETIV